MHYVAGFDRVHLQVKVRNQLGLLYLLIYLPKEIFLNTNRDKIPMSYQLLYFVL